MENACSTVSSGIWFWDFDSNMRLILLNGIVITCGHCNNLGNYLYGLNKDQWPERKVIQTFVGCLPFLLPEMFGM